MENVQVPLELFSNFLSIVVLIFIFVRYYQYKKKLNVLKELNNLKENNDLTVEDKEFIRKNLKDYKIDFLKDEHRIKLAYPVFILVAGLLIVFLSFQEAMIHLNVIIVVYIYMQISKLHNKNFVNFLEELNKDLEDKN